MSLNNTNKLLKTDQGAAVTIAYWFVQQVIWILAGLSLNAPAAVRNSAQAHAIPIETMIANRSTPLDFSLWGMYYKAID